ncbi:MAG: DUF2116 family Zn-ribbon domain-containing protein [bacterium]|nr:DUF2116 family Zn-ribbon domain-containing protein [bacterium]
MNRSEAGKAGYEKTKEQLDAQRQAASDRARQRHEENSPKCLNCGAPIEYENRRNKFCSQSCSATYSNQRRIRNTIRSRVCSCGNPKELANKYCKECSDRQVYHRIYKLEDATLDSQRRRILVEEIGHRCEVCGLSEWMGKPIPIELDHINGDSDNNSRENLRLICPNCHAQTDTYKGANAGKGSRRQVIRRRRYSDGKTY